MEDKQYSEEGTVITRVVVLVLVGWSLNVGTQALATRGLVQRVSKISDGLANKFVAAGLAVVIACTGLSCDRDDEKKLTREDKRHIHYVNGLLPIQEQDYTTYVHVESKYRNTRQRKVYEGDVVYFVEGNGVFGGIVERHVHPERVVIGQLYGTAIYADSGYQQRLVELDAIRGVSFQHHDDAGLIVAMANDDRIFRRDDDDYIERFYARVANVYDDGFYRAIVEYGSDSFGNEIYLHDSYTLFVHKDLWPTESVPLVDHPDLGADSLILGPEGTMIEYLIGRVARVYDDGFYEIEVFAELDFDQNVTNLAEPYSVFMHESTPLRDGGFLLRNKLQK